MANTPGVEDAAKEILSIAVRDLHMKPHQAIQAQPVMDRFAHLPWKPADLRPGLVFAQERGWITIEGFLTDSGYAAAPI